MFGGSRFISNRGGISNLNSHHFEEMIFRDPFTKSINRRMNSTISSSSLLWCAPKMKSFTWMILKQRAFRERSPRIESSKLSKLPSILVAIYLQLPWLHSHLTMMFALWWSWHSAEMKRWFERFEMRSLLRSSTSMLASKSMELLWPSFTLAFSLERAGW